MIAVSVVTCVRKEVTKMRKERRTVKHARKEKQLKGLELPPAKNATKVTVRRREKNFGDIDMLSCLQNIEYALLGEQHAKIMAAPWITLLTEYTAY